MRAIRCLLLLLCFLAAQPVFADPVISEFMASNKKTIKDEDGDASDWLEVYNPDTAAVNLNGWALTDNASNLQEWIFPAVTLPAKSTLLVWCSSKNRRVVGKPLHTNFDLKAAGEYLALVKPDGVTRTTEFAPSFPPQYQDISYGTSVPTTDVTLIDKSSAVRAFVPTDDALGTTWHAPAFSDSSWLSGTFAVGFMDYNATSSPNLQADLGLDLKAKTGIAGTGNDAYMRAHFNVTNPALISKLVLQASYDDGFYAWLDGTVAANSPSAPAELALVYNSSAPNHSPGTFETFDVSSKIGALVAGDNVLALQSLNVVNTSSDLYMWPKLIASIASGQAGTTGYFATPTPGALNGGNETIQLPQTIIASQASGNFTTSVTLTLSGQVAGQEIHYTIADPTSSPGANVADPALTDTKYTGPIAITTSKLIRAAVFNPTNGQKGLTQTLQYLLLETGSTNNTSSFTSAMPIFVVDDHGAGQPVDSDTDTRTTSLLYVYQPPTGGTASLTAAPNLVTRAGLDVRGSSSKDFPKKSYGLKLYNEKNANNSQTLLGLASDSGWVLNGPWTYDQTFIHNAFVYELSRQVGRWAPRVQFVEMFLNSNGGKLDYTDYAGIYGLTERIESGTDRLNITTLAPSDNTGDALTGGYIFKIDLPDPDEISWQTVNGVPDPSFGGQQLVLSEPSADDVTPAQIGYLRDNYVANFDATLFAERKTNFATRNYLNYIDRASFIDYHILNSMVYNVDGMRRSAYYFKDRDGKINAGPTWDYDRSLNTSDGRAQNPQSWSNIDFNYFSDDWWGQLFQDPDFVQAWIDRWRQLRAGALSTSNMQAIVSTFAAQIDPAADARDAVKWPPNAPINNSYTSEIANLKSYIATRASWIDGQLPVSPIASLASGVVSAGTGYTINGLGSPVYYTVDGSDPRVSGGGINPNALFYNSAIPVTHTMVITSRRYFGAVSPFPYAISTSWSAPVVTVLLVNESFAVAGDLAVSEVNYNPLSPTTAESNLAPGTAADDYEFVELRDVGPRNVNTFQVQFVDGLPFKALQLAPFSMKPGDYCFVVHNKAAFLARYGSTYAGKIVGEWGSGSLDNGGENVQILARDNSALQNFTYSDSGAWPGLADGKGSTLEYIGATYTNADYNNPADWRSSSEIGGTPGYAGAGPDGRVLVNEVLSHSNTPRVDAIELYNTTTAPIDLSGWYISDGVGTPDSALSYAKFRIPNGTTIPASGYKVYTEADFNPNGTWNANAGTPGPTEFAFDAHHGDEAWLIQPNVSGNPIKFVDHVQFIASRPDESWGRWPDGLGGLYPMLTRTLLDENSSVFPRPGLGAPNSVPRVGPLIINEVQSAPSNGNTDLQYIEIRNTTPQGSPGYTSGVQMAAAKTGAKATVTKGGKRTDNPASTSAIGSTTTQSLANWNLGGDVSFAFDDSTTLANGGLLVVVPFSPTTDTAKAAAFRTFYNVPASVTLVGPWTSGAHLGTTGQLTLYRADSPPSDEPGFYPQMWEDETTYGGTYWPNATGGFSLNRRGDTSVGDVAGGWKADVPSPGTYGPTYAQWKALYFPNGGAGSGPNDDPDHDGASNALEYSRGTNPNVYDAQISLTPTLTRQLASGATQYVFTFTKPVDRPGATYQVQQSTDLSNWSAAADTLVSKNLETETRSVTVNLSNGNPPKLFFRLSVAVGP